MRSPMALALVVSAVLHAAPFPTVSPLPGLSYAPPARAGGVGAPVVYEHSREAGPDQSFVLVGENLSTNLVAWGNSSESPGGQAWPVQCQFLAHGLLCGTLPESANDGPFLVWVQNAAGFSSPLVLNAPQPWWAHPFRAVPGAAVRVFGRNLARRPDFARAFVCVVQAGRAMWAEAIAADRYTVSFRLPSTLAPGPCELWVHAGSGGTWGWGGPVPMQVLAASTSSGSSSRSGNASRRVRTLGPGTAGPALQRALDELEAAGGGVVELEAGTYEFTGTLRVPGGVALNGAGMGKTTLQAVQNSAARFPGLPGPDWNLTPVGVQTPGDAMEYDVDVPQAGAWSVWIRYAADIPASRQYVLDGNMTLQAGARTPVPLLAITNTGSYSLFRWTKAAEMSLSAGAQKIVWRNAKGGGIALDAFVFALEPGFRASDARLPRSSRDVVVVQAEACSTFASRVGYLPFLERPAVWLAGDAAELRDVAVLGTAQLNLGVAIASLDRTRWLSNCVVERVRVADCDGKQGAENAALLARHVQGAVVSDNLLQGRAPLVFEGARGSAFTRNRLAPVTRYGNNAGAAITGRSDVLEECLIEDNRIVSPTSATAGGPTVRRLLWVSTGKGSVRHNWIARNGAEQMAPPAAGDPRFGGVAGLEPNVGEMILFIAHHRMAYHGPLADADVGSVTLPANLPSTPDARLGSVTRAQLEYDDARRETPFLPPLEEAGGDEPTADQYYVTILAGRGQGQSRRVARRDGSRFWLEQPWGVAPDRTATVTIATAFHQNLLVGNRAADGLTGVQLWISCLENVIAQNSVARTRRAGYFLFGNATTLASSMPRTWDRGLSPCYWNLVEGNVSEEAGTGIDLASEDAPWLPVTFPRLLGNVVRHNSFLGNRAEGVHLVGNLYGPRLDADGRDTSASLRGTIVEFNLIRDAATAFRVGRSCDTVLFRRNQTAFWRPVGSGAAPPVGFRLDDPAATVSLEHNTFEGADGHAPREFIGIQTPEGARPLP